MKKNIILPLILILSSNFWSCNPTIIQDTIQTTPTVKTGLDILFESHLDEIFGKNIGLVTNHSGINKNGESNVSLFLNDNRLKLTKIFSPEHGFSGVVADGEKIDSDTNRMDLPLIISLYGDSRKPTIDMYKDLDLIIYDIQDVGARFYTYISTLGLVMETAGEANIPVMVLDRPNPIGNKVEGPVLNLDFKSFVGQYPIPIRYGLTIGELAKMIVGEKLINTVPELIVIEMENYFGSYYDKTSLPWLKPSPNIVDIETAIVYPGLCLLQGTNVSDGRGTYNPIKRVGAPWIDSKEFSKILNKENLKGVIFAESKFTPIQITSMASKPKFQDIECYGVDIYITDPNNFDSVKCGVVILYQLLKMYPDKFAFLKKASISRLWGSDILYDKLLSGNTPDQIIDSYQDDLNEFLKIRDKYLIYN